MTTKELLKKEIDKMTENEIKKAYKLLKKIKRGKQTVEKKKIKIRAFRLGGQFDDLDLRKEAYE